MMKTSSKSYHFSCCYTAVASTSAPMVENLDTAVPVVSILRLPRKGF